MSDNQSRSSSSFPRRGVLGSPRGQPPGQYSGQRDTYFQKGIIPSPHTPVMHHAERKYDVGTITNEELITKQRQFQGILNKLTPQNFEKLFDQVKQVNIDNAVTLSGVVGQIFDKVLMEPAFVEMYANFCSRLSVELPDCSENNEKITFKRLLLNKCQEEFERGEREEEEANRTEEEGEVKQTEDEREEKRVEARRRRLGNIRFIGELYKKRMLTERIMHHCIRKLLGVNQTPDPDEENIEALCKLMSAIGKMVDHPKAKKYTDVYFDMMIKLSNNMDFTARVRFMLKDVIDLRNNRWQQRMKVEGPEKQYVVRREAAHGRHTQANRVAREPTSNRWARRSQMDFGPKWLNVLPLTPQMGGYRRLSQQFRAYGNPGPSLNTFDDRPWSRVRVTTPPQSGPLDKVMSEEQLHDKSIMMIKEFYSARDVKEVVLCIRDLNAPSFYPSMISIWVIDSFERKDVDRDSLTQLLINLAKYQDGILSQNSLVKGFEYVLSTLEDAVNDAPKAAEFLGRIFAKVLLENVIPYAEVSRLIYEGGEEQGRLVELGLAAKVLGVILEIIISEKGYGQEDLASRWFSRPIYDPSNIQEQNMNYVNRDMRNSGRGFVQVSPSSPPEHARVTTPLQSGPSDTVMSEEHLHDKSIETIKEFYSARDEKEVALCIRDLNAPSFYPSMISIWVIDSFERKDMDRESLTKLLINLAKSRDGILSQDSLVRGFESVLSTLEDAVIDAPKAAEFLGRIFAKVLLENVIPYTEVWRLIYEGGEEQGRLVEIGLAAEVLGVILEIIKAEKGDLFLNNMCMRSDLRLENFRPPTIKKTLRLDKFI